MHFTIEQEDATTIFRLKESRLDSQNSSQLKAEFLILAQADVETLIVDLTEVTYVDSSGLSALLLAERQQTAHGGDIRLVGVNPSVRSLLGLTQLDRVFPMFNSIDEALDAEPTFGDDDDEEEAEAVLAKEGAQPAQTFGALKAGAIAAGGSLVAAELASLMLDRKANEPGMSLDEDEDFDDDDDLEDDDDDLEEDDLLDDEDLDEDEEEVAEEVEPTPDAIVEEELIDDDDIDDDDLDEDDLDEEDEDF